MKINVTALTAGFFTLVILLLFIQWMFSPGFLQTGASVFAGWWVHDGLYRSNQPVLK